MPSTKFNRSLSLHLPGRWFRAGLGIAGCLSIAGAGGTLWLLGYVRAQIVPLIRAELEQAIDRSVTLGEVERLSPMGFRLGSSTIPATATDSDQVSIRAIEIGFNPIDALMTRRVDLTVTLVQPQLFLEQTAKGNWLATKIEFDSGSAIELKEIRLRDATVILAPSQDYGRSLKKPDRIPPARLLLERLNGSVKLSQNAQQIQFDLATGADTGGKVRLQGKADQTTDTVTAKLTTQNLAIAPWIALLPIPVSLQSGTIDSQVQVQLQPGQPFAMQGSLQIHRGRARAIGEPNPFSQINGRLRLDGQTIHIEQGHLQFGKIPFDVVGQIDLQKGLALEAKAAAVSAADFMQTFKLKLPFPVTGTLRSHQVRVSGSFDRVIFSGTAEAAQPLQFDRVQIAAAKAAFVLDKSTDRLTLKDIEFIPTSGGKITTNAQITLENDSAPLKVDVQASDISVDAIANLYSLSDRLSNEPFNQLLAQLTDRSASEPLQLGRMNADVTIAGTGNAPQISGQWQLRQGDFPASGKLTFRDATLQVEDTIVQFAQGTLNASGRLRDGNWQAKLSGQDLHLAGGLVQVKGQLDSDRWQATVTAADMHLGKLVSYRPDQPSPTNHNQKIGNSTSCDSCGVGVLTRPSGSMPLLQSIESTILSGQARFSGSLQSLSPSKIAASAQLQLLETGLINTPITANLQWQNDRLHILKAGTTGINLAGWIAPQLQGKPTIADMDLALQIDPIDLKQITDPLAHRFGVTLPQSVQLAGMAEFTGRFRGTLAAPQFTGQLQLNQLAVNQLQFDPVLAGNVVWQSSGLQIDLAGESDRLQSQFDRTLETGLIALKLNQATVRSHYSKGHLIGRLENLALEQVRSLTFPSAMPVSGLSPDLLNSQLSAHYNINLTQPQRPRAIAEITIAHSINQTNRLRGTLSYIDGTASVKQAELRLGDSRYTMNGGFTPDREGEFAAQISARQGQIGHLWQAMNAIQQIPWIGERAKLGQLQTSLKAIDPAALRGKFAAEVAVQGSEKTGIKSSFQVEGQNWGWQQYGFQQVSAIGTFDGSQIELKPLQLAGLTYTPDSRPAQVFDTKLLISGQYSSRSQQGQIALEKMPVAMIKNWLNTSAPVDGELNANANISGNGAMPHVEGEFKLSQLRLSQTALPEAHLRFQYAGDRLNVGGTSPLRSVAQEAAADASIGLETIYFKLGFIDFTLPIDVLNAFVTTGEIQEPLGFYAQFADPQALQTVRSILSQPLDPQKIDLRAIAASESGEAWLQWLGDVIQTHDGENGKTIMQNAILAAAAQKPNGFTLMDILHSIPARKLRINSPAVIRLLDGSIAESRPAS